eukprot:TRINITY_DN106662_c0_g1_i1.p1 TRINITY_DN106662_c0_g1~~TRINITY_DN106662_c0_g1_i1.p1  ORF type:complete len:294 (-),score=43.95 TRINITY_DN106662_c0_g1_i1:52-870(-)
MAVEIPQWLQKSLHSKTGNLVFPGALIGAASLLLVYCHATATNEADNSSKIFLGLIVIQMLPLLFLELNITSCPDPAAMLAVFGTKVLLLHGCFLMLRVAAWPLMEVGIGWSNVLGAAAVLIVLHCGFRFKWALASVVEHYDTLCLVLLGAGGAFVTEVMGDHSPRELLETTIHTASSYIEVLGFVPAVWMVYQSTKKSDDVTRTKGIDLKRQALSFVAFLISFYTFEDLVTAWKIKDFAGMAAAGHMVHFLMLLHFASFLLTNVQRAGTIF